MEYKFKGIITSFEDYEIPFQVADSIARFGLQSKRILPCKNRSVLLKGLTNDKKIIYLLIDRFFEAGFKHSEEDGEEIIEHFHIQGAVEACAVLDSEIINDIDSIGFYSLAMPHITGHSISGALNGANASWMGIKDTFGNFALNGHKYKLSIGFVDNEPYYSGQLLELKTDGKFDINSMKESYWLIKKFFMFLFQKRNVPIDDIFLRVNEKNVGRLFVERLEQSKISFLGIKCIQTNILKEKIDILLQSLADQKIYLRHVPMFKDEEKAYTPGRFLMALVGLENTLDLMDIHVAHSNKHMTAINNVRSKLEGLVSTSSGVEKDILNKFLKQLQKDENLESRILVSLKENKDYIANFFPLNILGDIPTIAKELSEVRNDLAHGDLNIDLGLKTDNQMHFLMLYVLYLQLGMIGFDNKEASEIVPQILFTINRGGYI